MERYEIVVIGAGAAGEAAAQLAAGRGARVAIIDRDLFGGSCPFWACMPSKALLHAAAVHACGGEYDWRRASDFRDYMINREGTDAPDDSSHVSSLEEAGATVLRGSARFVAPGRIELRHDGSTRDIEADRVIVAVGSTSRIPDLPGLDAIDWWTNRQGTGTRELPQSLVILGAGPTGVELAQVYARYGVPTTLVHPRQRIHDREHPRSSQALADSLRRDGVDIRTGLRAERVRARAGRDGAHLVELSDGGTAEGHELLLAIGRSLPLEDLNLQAIGVEPVDGRLEPDDQLRIADGVYVAGDVAGPELHTHLAHYQGELAARLALGEDVRPDHSAIPRATYTDPETASVGLQLDEAREAGIDAFEVWEDLATSAKGYVVEASGHVTIVVDRRSRVLVGAFIAGPGASEAIHEAVLAIKARVPLAVLADTIHAFPTVARVLGTTFMKANRELD
jgi:pyruvate/2-oxoglutarate dehydrogenase complex dihydrolipoamide dehydrogenase (E3) component